MSYGELIYIPVIWFAVLIIKQRRMYDIAIYLWFLVPYLFFSFCATKMQAYTVFAAPAIFIITANAFVFILEYAKKVKKLKWLYLMVGYGLIILPIRYSIERVKPFDIEYDRHPAWEKNIETFKTTPNNNSKTVVLGCEHCIELMFETDCIAYSYPVDSTNIQIIKSKGYNVINWKD